MAHFEPSTITITITNKMRTSLLKWLHTILPPTCFGQPGGCLQGGILQRIDTLEDKLVK
jgi:hypothetical protein